MGDGPILLVILMTIVVLTDTGSKNVTCKQALSVPLRRDSGTAYAISEQIYISGGTEKTQITNRVQCYDHRRNIWTEKPALHTGIITEAVI